MQDPKAIVEQVMSGTIPQAWRVIRPRRGYALLAGLRGLFLGVFVAFAAGIIGLIALSASGSLGASSLGGTGSTNDPGGTAAALSTALLVPICLGGLVLVIVPVIVGFRAKARAPWSLLILAPDAAVQSLGPNTLTALDFAAIDQITPLLDVRTYTQRDSKGNVTSRRTTTQMYAKVNYRDGRTVRWHPNWRFGNDQDVVQQIATAHKRYLALISPSGNPR